MTNSLPDPMSRVQFHRPSLTEARVLIVSASAGTGHVTAGRALHSAFAATGLADPVHVDVLDLAPRWVRAAYGGGFELLASRAPAIWREVYRFSDGADFDQARWGTLAQHLMFRAFHRLLTSERWSACVCTHFLPAQLAAGRTAVPFASVVTDFTLHRYWVHPRVQQYFVAAPDIASDLRRRLSLTTADVTGIPIARLDAHRSRAQARAALGLVADARIALVMGGGLGIGVEASARAALDSGIPGLQIVAVCGRNSAAHERLAGLGIDGARLRVLGFADDMAALYAAADVVVTKPGGLTCSEALAMGRPLVLTRAIPGHEEGNVRHLTAAGAALSAPTDADVAPALRNLLLDSEVLGHCARNARAAGMPDAAHAIAHHVAQRFTRTAAA
jgi:processive 1,2-diacylglycerol beta-glucosyltransferase